MSKKFPHTESPASGLKNDAARQRWELFHQAIAQAKQANVSAMQDADESRRAIKRSGPLLSIAR